MLCEVMYVTNGLDWILITSFRRILSVANFVLSKKSVRIERHMTTVVPAISGPSDFG